MQEIISKESWIDLIGVDIPSQRPVTEETVWCTLKNASRFRGSVRASTGRIWTDHDYEARRKRVLRMRLP